MLSQGGLQAEVEVTGIRHLLHLPQPRLARRKTLQKLHQVAVVWRPQIVANHLLP